MAGERYGDLVMKQLEEDSDKMSTHDLVTILATCLQQVTHNDDRKRMTRNILQNIRRRADLDLSLYNKILQRSRA
ncbi:hypothetical protein [Nonomuraea maheshkhaliensis]|uniref:hypothetical protein n=1 Tax=Nonomuraea maheshkhaliensis TaxID=419590 RepID=UPI0031F84E23